MGLHFAPHRWLLIEPDEAELTNIEAGGAHVFEVSGKWQAFRVASHGAQSALRSGVDVESVLHERSCARLLLYDCPVIVAWLENELMICVESSYADSLSVSGASQSQHVRRVANIDYRI
jgi:hypothetical protein